MRTLFCLVISLLFFLCASAQTVSGDKSLCGGSSDVLTVSGITASDHYIWQYSSDGNNNWNDISGTADQPDYTADKKGFYRIKVTSNNNKLSNEFEVIDSPKPDASFSFTPNNECSSTPVAFTNTVTPGAVYAWNFGDINSGSNNISANANPSHLFIGQPGNGTQDFNVELTVTSKDGCVSSITHSVSTKQVPDATLNNGGTVPYQGKNYFTSCNGVTPADFEFINDSKTSSTNTTYKIQWGDGNSDFTSTGFLTENHSYTTGQYPLNFIVTGQNGCSNTTSYFVFVGTNPAAGFANPGNSSICTGTTLTFPITSTTNNPPTTIYTVTFNDGTPVITYQHPPPADVTHTFLTTSCGTDSKSYLNSFSAVLTASNPCQSSAITVEPIFVSQKAEPSITVTPKDTDCVNSTVTFTNSSPSNYNNNNGTCTLGKSVWTVTPATGWTITSGSLGDDRGLTNPASWIDGSLALSLKFTTVGNYTIKLKTGNTNCGSGETTKTICVSSAPIADFTTDAETTGCAPFTINTINNSNHPECGRNKYVWTVTSNLTAGCDLVTPSYEFIGGTDANSENPQFRFNSAGTYTVSLVNTFDPSGCSSPVASKIITIKEKPKVSIDNIASVCQSKNINPTASYSCNIDAVTTYQWSFPGGSPSSSTSANPGTINYTQTGSNTITLAVTNTCGTTTDNQTFTVNALPVITVPPSSAYCAGTTTSAFDFTSNPAAAVTWTNNNTSTGLGSSSGTGNIAPFTTVNNTSSTQVSNIDVSATANGCTGNNSFAITVYPKLNAPIVTPAINYCIGQTATPLTATPNTGNTLLWYTTASGGTALPSAPTPATTTAETITYYVSQLSSIGNCESPRAAISVIVNPTPTFTATPTDPTQCGIADGSIQLKGLTSNTTYTVAYTQNGANQTTKLISDNNGIINIENLPAGLYEHVVVAAFGCPSEEKGPFTLLSPTAPETPTLTSSAPICSGNTLELHAKTTSAGTATWSWSGPNGFTNSSPDPTIPAVPVAASGTYHATATINNCTSAAGDVTVVINLTPATPTVTSNSPVCSGETITFTNTPGGSGVTYNWSGPNGFTSADQNPSITTATTAMTGTYKVTSTSGNCTSAEGSASVTVHETPAITSASSKDPLLCASPTGSITVKGLTASQNYTVVYTKNNSPVSRTLSSNTSGDLIIDALTAGTYNAIQVSLNNCLSNTAGPFTLNDPTPPPTPVITGNATLCSGNTLTLSVSDISGATYAWTGPGGYVNTTAQATIPNTVLLDAGIYNVTITVAGCTSPPAATDVVINPTPVVTAGSNSPVCSGNEIHLSAATSFGGNLTWQWIGPDSYSSTEQNPVIINAAANTTTDTYKVIATATTGNCPSQASTTQVIVHPTPVIVTTDKISPSACATPTGSITLHTSLPNTSFVVHYTYKGNTESIALSSDGNRNIIISALAAGNYEHIYIEAAGCSSTETADILLNDPTPPDAPMVNSNTPLCAGATLNLTATSNNTGTYAWSGPNSFTSTNQNPAITDVAANNAGTYNVTITVNNCTSPPGSANVIVNPLAAAPAAATPVAYCINTTAVPLTATATNGSSLNWYEVASEGTASPTAPTPVTATAGSVFYYVSQTSTAGCEGVRTTIEVVTHPDAKAVFLPTQTLGCSPFVLTGSLVNLQSFPANNGNYQWYANEALIGSGATFPGYTIQNDHDSVTIKLKAVSLFGCRDDSTAQKFYTYQLPKTAFITDKTSGCGPLPVSFTNQTPQASLFKFKWIFGNGETSTDENPQPVVFATNPTYGDTTYHVTLLGYTICDTITATTDILVKSKPRALFAPDKTSGCSPLKVHFDNISKGVGTTYQWFFGDGAGITANDASAAEHVYNTGVQDTFYAKLVATNECGTDTSTFAIVVSPNKVKLNVAINGNQTTGCAPHLVQFINRSSGASTFAWTFGDGEVLNTTKNIDTVSHTYTKSGTYTAILFASNGCSDTTTTETITVFDKPAAGFTALPLSACIGDTISFTNKATNYSSLFWQFGDNSTSTLSDPQHAYTTAGTYNAVLIAQKQYDNGTVCSDTATTSIAVVDHLPGAFSASETVSACVPFTVTFTNTTLPSALTTWSFGDGALDTGDVVTHTFVLPGAYNVSMQAKHPAGCLYEAGKQITAKGPAGSISYAAGYVCSNTAVRFEANTSNTDSVTWNFGDGESLTTRDRVIYHVFSKPGVFVPSAELISGNACRVRVATNDTIKVDYLQAGFAQQQDKICGKTIIYFRDTSSSFFGLQQWQWSLGDGNISVSQNPIHDYTATGTLPIQLITISNSGCADTATVSLFVKVNNKPVASINGTANACDLLPVAYGSSVSSIDSVSLYQWTITPNASYNTNSIIHTFPNAGNYSVQLVAGTVYGCYDTVIQKVIVNTTPLVAASADATICRGAAAALSVTGNASQYNWQTDASLSCTACANPLAAPLSTTQYYVTGTATNGCSRTDSVLINVVQPFTLTVSAGDSICIGQSKQLTVSGASQYIWSPAATLDDSTSQHPVATPAASTTYSVTGTDDYHCFTNTKTVVVGVGQYPVISLGRDTLLSTGTIYPLHSVVTEGPIQTYAWSPADNLSCTNCTVPDANIKRPVCYSVTATNYYGCSGRDTVCIQVFCQNSQVFIANIFTPDGDGVNDKLIVQGKGISMIRSFRIFNRWGQVVFEKSGFLPNDASSGWDGRINGGALASPDVYVYTCDVVCDDGTVYPLKGNVAIVK